MIKREIYMSRIRPFIGNELIKVLTGIRRSGKSVMLSLIQEELAQNGVQPEQFISLNFENMSNAHLCTAVALHDEILRRTKEISGKVYLFFDEIQEVADWEKCINSFRVELDCDIYITGSNAKLLSGELATYLAGRYVEFVIYPFSFREFMELYHTVYEGADERLSLLRASQIIMEWIIIRYLSVWAQMMCYQCVSLHFLMERSRYYSRILHILFIVYGLICTVYHMRSRSLMII